jgi:nitrate reductase NapE
MSEAEIAINQNTSASPPTPLRKTEEIRTWFFLTVVMAPVLAVLTVSGFGFVVWMYQLLTGLPAA